MPEVLGKPIRDVLGGGGKGQNGLSKGNARGRAQAGGFAAGKQRFRQPDVAPNMVQRGGR